jgi:hypothetical protein
LKKRTKKLLLPARQRVRDSRAKVFCFFSTEKQIFLVWLSTKVKFRFGAHFALHSAGSMCCRSAPRCFGGLGVVVLWQCKSGSGASLGVPRSAKSDRMYLYVCVQSVGVRISETAAFAFRGVL